VSESEADLVQEGNKALHVMKDKKINIFREIYSEKFSMKNLNTAERMNYKCIYGSKSE
jgi:hypothetical protein